jgi:hypothetical protein
MNKLAHSDCNVYTKNIQQIGLQTLYVRMLLWLINTWHMKQTVHIRAQCSLHTISASPSQWHQGLCSRVKKMLSSVCSQEVTTCITSASTPITCQPGASQGFSERSTTEHKIGSDPQLIRCNSCPWHLAFSCQWTILWQSNQGLLQKIGHCKLCVPQNNQQSHHGQGSPKQAHVYGPKTAILGLFTDDNVSIFFVGGRW